jgi:hypothetical protein
MVCTEYQERINDLALAGAAGMDSAASVSADTGGDAALAQHLVACARCRAELDYRRALLARIDSGIVAMVAVEPSPSLAVLVRQQIAEESTASRSFAQRWGWWIGATAATAAIAAIAFALIPRSTFHSAVQSPNVAATQNSSAPSSPSPAPSVSASGPAGETPSQIPSPQQTIHSTHAPITEAQATQVARVGESETAAPSLEVLIPANQRIALVQLAVAGAHNQLDERILVREAATTPLPAIEVKPLKIDLLESLDSQGGDGSEDFN